MTCAHVVNVALKKVPGVESVDVSLNKGLATVKLKPGNTVTVPQLWQLIHEKGYTPKATNISIRGELVNPQQLKVSGQILALTGTPPGGKPGQTITIQGVMTPAKDLKAPVPIQVK